MIIEKIESHDACIIKRTKELAFISDKTIWLGHGCNCFNKQNAGLALILKKNFLNYI